MQITGQHITIDNIDDNRFVAKQVKLSVARLDRIHPVISGNKLFKLHYFLEEAIAAKHPRILTFGGAYSNHLVATAFVCKEAGVKAIGIVRGERPAILSNTLEDCLAYGMQLKFISRGAYAEKDDPVFLQQLEDEFGPHTMIPEGGYHPLGAKGAALILDRIDNVGQYSHIACPVGTATTVAGLIISAKSHQKILGFAALKGLIDLNKRLSDLIDKKSAGNFVPVHEYSFGGYAKKNNELIAFMNGLYKAHAIPTDFIYTAKMIYGLFDMTAKDIFEPGSNILCLHTGGLQGNLSLPVDTLLF